MSSERVHTRKITVVGSGNVGTTTAQLVAERLGVRGLERSDGRQGIDPIEQTLELGARDHHSEGDDRSIQDHLLLAGPDLARRDVPRQRNRRRQSSSTVANVPT